MWTIFIENFTNVSWLKFEAWTDFLGTLVIYQKQYPKNDGKVLSVTGGNNIRMIFCYIKTL